jgi:integrase
MPIVTLSHDFVSKAVCPESKKKINYYHKDIRGFLLEVRSSGGKTYALRYRDKHNRQCQYKIGDSKDISFEKARRAAEKARGKVVLGQDPNGDKRTKRKVPTLSYFVQFNYLVHIKHKRSFKADFSMLRCHILPRFGKIHMDKITTQAVNDFHQGMVSKGLAKGTANRGLVLLKYMYNLAIKWQIPGVIANPAAGVKLFEANNARERFLTAEETQRLLAAVEKSKNTQLKYIVPLLLLLGCRKRELLDAR